MSVPPLISTSAVQYPPVSYTVLMVPMRVMVASAPTWEGMISARRLPALIRFDCIYAFTVVGSLGRWKVRASHSMGIPASKVIFCARIANLPETEPVGYSKSTTSVRFKGAYTCVNVTL